MLRMDDKRRKQEFFQVATDLLLSTVSRVELDICIDFEIAVVMK